MSQRKEPRPKDTPANLDAMPPRTKEKAPHERANEGLSNDYSIEGTRQVDRDDERVSRKR